MLFLSIPAKSLEFIQRTIAQYEEDVDGFEIRWDFAKQLEPQKVRSFTARPLIYTLRSKSQGGQGDNISWDDIQELAKAHPDYLDLEYNLPPDWFKKIKDNFPQINVIASFHDLHKVPDILPKMPDVDIQKFACFCPSSLDALRLLSFSKKLKKDFILIGMGENAQFTRIMNLALGSMMTFACLPQEAVAPGQISVDEMNSIYRVRDINQYTRFYALLGKPVEHSIGHIFHNSYFHEHQQNARYIKIEVSVDELKDFLQEAFHFPFDGMSVTMPLKFKAFEYSVSQDSFKSVNTLKRKGHDWLGFNTDIPAIWQALKSFRPTSVIILGAGGVGMSLYEDFKSKGIKVYLFNRSQKAGKLILGFDEDFPGADLIINTLPHLDEHIKLKLSDYLNKPNYAIDLVYAHFEFSEIVKAKNIPLISGQEIFNLQALLQQEIWRSNLDTKSTLKAPGS